MFLREQVSLQNPSILQFVIVESNDENHSTICSSKNEKGKLQNQNFVPN